jgi:hypothetical protein
VNGKFVKDERKILDHGSFFIGRVEAEIYITGRAIPLIYTCSCFILNGLLVTAAHVIKITDLKNNLKGRKADRLIIYLGHSHKNEGFKIEIDNPVYGINFIHHKDYTSTG